MVFRRRRPSSFSAAAAAEAVFDGGADGRGPSRRRRQERAPAAAPVSGLGKADPFVFFHCLHQRPWPDLWAIILAVVPARRVCEQQRRPTSSVIVPALDLIRDKNILLLLDSHLEGKFSIEEATALVDLASRCLQYEPRERPKTEDLVATLAPLQTKQDVPSHVMLGIQKHEEAPPAPVTSPRPLSPMGEACSRMDLTAIHQILVMTHYRDDEGINELSFQEWTQQMRDLLEARKRGDFAFRDKDFKTAIDCYSQFINVGAMTSPTVYARRSLCHLMSDQADDALRDAMQAQVVFSDWPTAFYMQSVALAKLNMHDDAADMLKEAAALEEKRQKGGRFS